MRGRARACFVAGEGESVLGSLRSTPSFAPLSRARPAALRPLPPPLPRPLLRSSSAASSASACLGLG